MKFGVALGRARPTMWGELSLCAEEYGYESMWVAEHLVLPAQMTGSPVHGAEHPPIPPQTPVFDAMNFISYLAGLTTTMRFGTYVYNIGLRHPFISARAAATVDIVSGGRFDFGIGASWLRGEWEAMGLDFGTRGARVDEALQVCRALWTEPTVEHHGRFFDFDAVMFEPKPVTPQGPPLHIGGDARVTLHRVAEYGDGWIPMNHSLEQLADSLPILAGLWSEHGRAGRPEITTSARAETVDDVRRAEAAGVDRLIVSPWRRSRDAADGLKRFSDDVIAAL